jgi:triacylglycerol lipase
MWTRTIWAARSQGLPGATGRGPGSSRRDPPGQWRPVFVTGHCQGRAEAVLTTGALLAGGFPVVSTYTFAAPRRGNLAFIESIPKTLPIHHIEFGDDIVPHVPPIMISREVQKIVGLLKFLPNLPGEVGRILDFLQKAKEGKGFASLGKLCYGSYKIQALRVDLTAEQEIALFHDRVWSLARHPDNLGRAPSPCRNKRRC